MGNSDATGQRAFNVRLIVSAIRATGALSKAEIARRTGLSGQAASVIVNTLLEQGLLRKLGKVRGQVGQPSTPIALDPRGAFAIGLKIGRRSLEAMAVDFLGTPIGLRAETYDAPLPDRTMTRATAFVRDLVAELSPQERGRIAGLGLAIPGDLHAWAAEMELPEGALDDWRVRDVAAELSAESGLETTLYNDATAACASEVLAGEAIRGCQSALHFFIGAFVGGGMVIDGRLYRGAQRNAGAIGSMPLGAPADGPPAQLIAHASAITLERALADAGLEPAREMGGEISAHGQAVFDVWLDGAGPALAQAAVAASAVIDVEVVVIDGVLPEVWRARTVERVGSAVGAFNRAGLSPFIVRPGTVGPNARVIGAALLPLADRFSPDTEVLARAPRL